MYVSVNKKNEIKMVGVSTDPNLTALYINDDNNPFDGWSSAKICCYKVNVKEGIVMMLTPYVDSRMIEHFDALGLENEVNASDISDNSDGIYEIAEIVSDDSECIYDLADIISLLDERVTALEDK